MTPLRAREADLSEILARVEKASGPDREIDTAIDLAFCPEGESRKPGDRGYYVRSIDYPDGSFTVAHVKATPYTSSIDAAWGLVERVLPGWMWRVATCSVSDDAWVCPDFNHPTYGAEFRARFNDAFGGRDPAEVIIEATDVDRRPPGQPALAIIQSLLVALIFLRTQESQDDHKL